LEQAANKGDIAAKRILVKFGQQFGKYAVCALKKLNMLDMPADIVVSGSIFKCREPELRDGVYSVVSREAPYANVVDAEFEPIVGAYISGISLLHTIDDEVYSSIRNCSDHFGTIRTGG
jgi:N-acetylglucosamine kinase-like BadF-type ATPase